MHLHQFQSDAVDYALRSANKYTAVTSPTRTGKSYMILACRGRLPNSWIITPRLEIIAGFLKKLGYTEAHNYSEQQLIETSLSERITTPIRLKNMLLAGMRDEYGNSIRIDRLLIDELHHHNAETYQLIDACTDVPAIGFTATYFRGTPKGSKQLRDTWGAPFQAITYKKAAEQGYIQLPTYSTVPLVDDDCVEIQNGEFVIDSLESTTLSRLDDAVKLFHSLHGEDGQIERIPTMVSLPSRRLVAAFLHTLNSAGFDAVAITQETSQRDRQEAFSRCLSCRSILLQINVVSEGVDLPIKRLIDMRPWISPVGWLQQIGRIMQPGGIPPEYICTNRNLMRHAYLLEGLVPLSRIVEAQDGFPISSRAGMRAIGLESIGRFKPVFVRTQSGVQCTLYNLTCNEQTKIVQYCVLLHPAIPNPLIVRKQNEKGDDDSITWGKWQKIEEIPTDFSGFQSAKPNDLSTNQLKWWKKSARIHGIDDLQPVTSKNFQILPVLSDTHTRLP